MKTIILGCPYNGIKELKNSLKKILSANDLLFDVDNILAIDNENIYFNNHRIIKIKNVSASFIRYPYDLIPPHSGNYNLREKTEFLKTVAILLADSAVNKFSPSLIARNRIFSLSETNKSGFKIPLSLAIKNTGMVNKKITKPVITKSLGNCYYSEKLINKNSFVKKTLSFEQDGGETAYIYPAHQITNIKLINKYINSFGTIFIQNKIIGPEFRVFIISNKIFFFRRLKKNKINEIDKSGNILEKCNIPINKKEQAKLIKLRIKLGLNYLCLDAIINQAKEFVIIDVNPFGSFPRLTDNTEVPDELAKFMYSLKK